MSSTFDLFAERLNVTREQLLASLVEHIDTGIESHDYLYHPEDVDCEGPAMRTTTRFTDRDAADDPNSIVLAVYANPDDHKDRPVPMVRIRIEPLDFPVIER